MSFENTALISEAVKKEIDYWLQKYPADHRQSASLIALRLVQEQNGGWLTTELMDAVAAYLDVAKTSIYEVATFYGMYNLKPVGKHKVAVCNSISCMLNGSQKIIDHLKQRFGDVPMGEPSRPDGCFYLQEAECLAACGRAPVMQIDNCDYHENLTIEKVDEILDKINED